MSEVSFKGNPVAVGGTFPAQGQSATSFTLVGADLSEKTLADYSGRRKVLNIFPSVDTGVCAASVRRFNELAADLDNTVVLCISADLPFAQARFCAADGLDYAARVRVHVAGGTALEGEARADDELAALRLAFNGLEQELEEENERARTRAAQWLQAVRSRLGQRAGAF